jgi:hypothetical protein
MLHTQTKVEYRRYVRLPLSLSVFAHVLQLFLNAYDEAKRIHEELDDDQEMISPSDFGLMLVDWTDPTKAVQM